MIPGKRPLIILNIVYWGQGDAPPRKDVNLDIRYHFGCFRNYTNSTTHKINYFIQESTGCIILGK